MDQPSMIALTQNGLATTDCADKKRQQKTQVVLASLPERSRRTSSDSADTVDNEE
jgi:hypothetical protein